MPDRRTLIYTYDGSLDGLMCCVFESYHKNEIPLDIMPEDSELPELLPVKAVETDTGTAKRVLESVKEKVGYRAYEFIRRAFLTCHPQRELLILRFLRTGYSRGPSVMDMLADTVVHELKAAVLHLE
jgi:probable DNA metabolism protein